MIAEAQRAGGMAAFVDAEHALDAQYAQKLGVDLDNLLVSQPDHGEQALEIVEVLIRSGIDVSWWTRWLRSCPSRRRDGRSADGSAGTAHAGLLRKLTGVVAKSKTILIFINQLREKIGVMFGNPEVQRRPRAEVLRVRIDIRRIASIKDGDQVIGGHARQGGEEQGGTAIPRSGVRRHGIEGISREGDLIDLAVEKRIIEKSGAWFAAASGLPGS